MKRADDFILDYWMQIIHSPGDKGEGNSTRQTVTFCEGSVNVCETDSL